MSPTLKILVIGNFSVEKCGIRNFADLTYEGLHRSPSLTVDKWDATYDLIYARREAQLPTYLPDDWATYDVIHLNWHPIALNTYTPDHFPWVKGEGPLVSVYLNDVPPWTGCPFIDRAECVVAAEPFEGGPDHLMVYPIPDWVNALPEPDPAFTVGWSGVRGDGAALLRGVCTQHDWAMNESTPGVWLSTEDEIRRLARSTVNVCWYAEGRGISGTPGVMLAARRPLLLNDSSMFKPWRNQQRYGGELYLPKATRTLEQALTYVHEDWKDRFLKTPGPRVYRDHAWTTAAKSLANHWRTTLEAR